MNVIDKYAVVDTNNSQIIDSWLEYGDAEDLASKNDFYGIIPMSEII